MGKKYDSIKTETAILLLAFCYLEHKVHSEIVKYPDGRVGLIFGNAESHFDEHVYRRALDYAIAYICAAPLLETFMFTYPKSVEEVVSREYVRLRIEFNKTKAYSGRIKPIDQKRLMQKVWENLSTNADVIATREKRRQEETLTKWERRMSSEAQRYFNDEVSKRVAAAEHRRESLLRKLVEHSKANGFFGLYVNSKSST